eukprot:6299451-Pyramimonas_sp.AAC.1
MQNRFAKEDALFFETQAVHDQCMPTSIRAQFPTAAKTHRMATHTVNKRRQLATGRSPPARRRCVESEDKLA